MEFLDKEGVQELVSKIKEEIDGEGTVTQAKLLRQMNKLSSLILNGMGLHITEVETEDGVQYYMHNHSTLAESDIQYVFAANGFLVSTDYGQTWNAGMDAEGNAIVNSLSTVVLKALEIYGAYIEGTRLMFGDPNDKNVVVEPLGDEGVSFNGNGAIQFNTTNTFEVLNTTENETLANELLIAHEVESTEETSLFSVANYHSNGNVSNSMSLNTSETENGRVDSRFGVTNYNTDGIEANNLSLASHTVNGNETNELWIKNRDSVAEMDMNSIYMQTSAGQNALRLSNYNSNGWANGEIAIQDATSFKGITLDWYGGGNVSTQGIRITDTGITLSSDTGDVSISDGTNTFNLFDAMKLLPTFYRLSANSSVTFNINNGQFMAVLFVQRYSASQTGAVCLLEQYSTHYTTLGSLGAITVTKGTGRQFTVSNSSSSNVELIGLCGYFS